MAATSALCAGLLSAGLVVVLTDTSENPRRAADGENLQAQPASTVVPAGSDVVRIAELVRPAIAQLRVESTGGYGSGVLFRGDGHLLTNAHVVEGTQTVKVTLASGRSFPGRVVGADPDTDTAVVKIDGGPFPVATLGTAADLKVGQVAVAIGSPLGLAGGPSVTVGVVSAVHRGVRAQGGRSLFDMIQADAPIAPGSSGGALLDGSGNVIGITTAIAVTDVGAEGFSFAIPIDVARSVSEQLMTTGHVTHVWMGIEGSDLDGATAASLDVDGGALVGHVSPGSPAERVGLAVQDVIVAVDGSPVTSMGELVALLRRHRPGEAVGLTVLRDGRRLRLDLGLVERPAEKAG